MWWRSRTRIRRDARLRFDPSHLPRTEPGPEPRAVLLTGGTGFFGPFLLLAILFARRGIDGLFDVRAKNDG